MDLFDVPGLWREGDASTDEDDLMQPYLDRWELVRRCRLTLA